MSATHQEQLQALIEEFETHLTRLAESKNFAKTSHIGPVLDLAGRLLHTPGGASYLLEKAEEYDKSGLFEGTDWASPEHLKPSLVSATLISAPSQTVVLELISEIRLLAIAEGIYDHPHFSAQDARSFLNRVMALNPDFTFQRMTEAMREHRLRGALEVFALLVERIGYEEILESVIEEAWLVLRQRPIMVDQVKAMITHMSVVLVNSETSAPKGAWRLVSALFGPTHATETDPGIDVYSDRLASMDVTMLQSEASGFARAMHDTGLVSPYHPVFLHFLVENNPSMLPAALGLSSTGTDVLLTFRDLVHTLIKKAVTIATPQAAYGLTRLLERGVLYSHAVAPALWRQIQLKARSDVRELVSAAYGNAVDPEVHLLAGLLCMLGCPLGVGQGQNPTCQSARALSMWAYNDPDYLMQLLIWAARDGEISMHFEGERIRSVQIGEGLAGTLSQDLDPVSLVLVPHLDRIYIEMGRKTVSRGEDSHKWINPEFHGWWVGNDFAIAVDVATGKVTQHEDFIRRFFTSFHPFYNNNQPVIHPQPAGIAATDSQGRFVGWHAITIVRVALDHEGNMRVYFFNPNNNSRQDWGQGVMVSTEGSGEYFGESSLIFPEFASRLYIFHYDENELGELADVPQEKIAAVKEMAEKSWAALKLG